MFRRYLAFVLGAIILLFIPVAFVSPLRDAASRVIKPFGHFLTTRNVAIRNAWLNLTSIGSVRDEKNNLQQQVITLQQQLIDDEGLKQENADLRKQLGVTGVTKEMPKAFAHVILQGDNPLDYTFTIDIGHAQGVKVGQPAVAEGALIGRVIEVREQSAVVRAVTSLTSRVQVWLTSNQEKGFLVGTGSSAQLQEITQGIDIPAATVIETSGLGGSLPQGILVGSTGDVLSAKSDLTQTFRVQLPVDPVRLQSLFILLTDQP
jgi:rod shape-determining protein MreC